MREYIICENLTKRFGRKVVVKDVNIFVEKGEVVGLLGPNGAGKTTIFNMILGIVVPTSGKIFLNGMDITNLPVYKRARMGITYLQQETSVFSGITVWENLELVLSFFEKDRLKKERTIEKLLKDFGIYSLKDQIARDLSGGEKRRLELARMMTLNPSFLLLDEPFVGIDPKTVKDIQKMVLELKTRGLGIIITDHNVNELVKVVDRLYIIHKGSIIAEGPPERALTDKKVREVFLGV
ncbi:MAG TPA: LPS export ABC transporter ATP-binding protein [Thermotoga sp.]|nr:LPS export ABC transporter ATP-binding protein [Thermotoga sp.]